MIDEKEILPFNFFTYGGKYTGRHFHMHYKINRIGDKPDFSLQAMVWKGPFESGLQPEEALTKQEFPYSEEGRLACIAWLREKYEEKKEYWDNL